METTKKAVAIPSWTEEQVKCIALYQEKCGLDRKGAIQRMRRAEQKGLTAVQQLAAGVAPRIESPTQVVDTAELAEQQKALDEGVNTKLTGKPQPAAKELNAQGSPTGDAARQSAEGQKAEQHRAAHFATKASPHRRAGPRRDWQGPRRGGRVQVQPVREVHEVHLVRHRQRNRAVGQPGHDDASLAGRELPQRQALAEGAACGALAHGKGRQERGQVNSVVWGTKVKRHGNIVWRFIIFRVLDEK